MADCTPEQKELVEEILSINRTDYYKVLKVDKSSNEVEIKKSYRKLAIKLHPDKNKHPKASEAFKVIAKAFEVLGDDSKRKMYDMTGSDPDSRGGMGGGSSGGPGMSGFSGFQGFPQGGMGGGGLNEEILNMLFGMGGMGGMGGMPQQQQQQQKREAEVVDLNVPCSLEEFFNGGVKKLKINRKGKSGANEAKIIEINIKPGWKAGTKITYPNEGDYKNGMRQTLRLILADKPNPSFKREDNNLRAIVKLSFKESLLGFQQEFTTISGRKLHLSRSTPTQPNFTETFPGQGMPISKQPGKFGDLIVEYKVDYPVYLNAEQKQAISQNF